MSPNGDGINEKFHIDSIRMWHDVTLIIYNRWGNKVVEINNYEDPQNTWDGKTKNGHPVSDGVYFWVLVFNKNDYKGDLKDLRGNVTIVH